MFLKILKLALKTHGGQRSVSVCFEWYYLIYSTVYPSLHWKK